MNDGIRKKEIKLFFSFVKEKFWLEEMAKQGWIFKNLTLGMVYTFQKKEARSLLYEIDRFNIPRNPTLKDIRYKEEFLSMAEDMGWQAVTHDEDLNYYFCKEFEAGDINELYNDEESRLYRAQKFRKYFYHTADRLTKLLLIFLCFTAGLVLIPPELSREWQVIRNFIRFNLFFMIFTWGLILGIRKYGDSIYQELLLTREKWIYYHYSDQVKRIRKLILTNRSLNRFLTKQSEAGWRLIHMTPTLYTFQQSEEETYRYTLDTKYLTNKRRRLKGSKKLSDPKDWNGINNDWQVESVKDAESKGWKFVCAFENRSVIYQKAGKEEEDALNPPKYDNSLRFISLVGFPWFLTLLSGLLGGILGMILGYFIY